MFTTYFIFTASLTTVSLIWRAILLDHPDVAVRIEKIPMIGSSLYCGFCAPLWFTLIATCMYNPLPGWNFVVSWLTAGAGVLFLRNLIAVLMELGGILTHKHRSTHD